MPHPDDDPDFPTAAVTVTLIGPAPPWRGGIAHHTTLLATELSRRHQVEIVTFIRQYPSLLFPGTSQQEAGTETASVPVIRMIDSMNPLSWLRAGRYLRTKGPDLVVFAWSLPFFGPCFGTIASTAAKNPAVRVLFLCHNVIPHERRPGDAAFTKFAFRRAHGFVVQSEAVRRNLLEMLPDASVRMAHHPVYEGFGEEIDRDEARRTLGVRGEKVLLFFGYVRPYKGLSVLLNALSQLEDVRLLVAGEFYEREQTYRDLVAELNLTDRVDLVSSYVPKDKVKLYFSAADAVIAPYLSATQSGIVQLAFSFNRPVIASDVGGLSEVVRPHETGRLVPPGDPGALAGAIRAFYDAGEAESLRRSVQEHKKAYSWGALAAAVESFMDPEQPGDS